MTQLPLEQRFVPAKRVAVDGTCWWCVMDRELNMFSPFSCHGKYRTKKESTTHGLKTREFEVTQAHS